MHKNIIKFDWAPKEPSPPLAARPFGSSGRASDSKQAQTSVKSNQCQALELEQRAAFSQRASTNYRRRNSGAAAAASGSENLLLNIHQRPSKSAVCVCVFRLLCDRRAEWIAMREWSAVTHPHTQTPEREAIMITPGLTRTQLIWLHVSCFQITANVAVRNFLRTLAAKIIRWIFASGQKAVYLVFPNIK